MATTKLIYGNVLTSVLLCVCSLIHHKWPSYIAKVAAD